MGSPEEYNMAQPDDPMLEDGRAKANGGRQKYEESDSSASARCHKVCLVAFSVLTPTLFVYVL